MIESWFKQNRPLPEQLEVGQNAMPDWLWERLDHSHHRGVHSANRNVDPTVQKLYRHLDSRCCSGIILNPSNLVDVLRQMYADTLERAFFLVSFVNCSLVDVGQSGVTAYCNRPLLCHRSMRALLSLYELSGVSCRYLDSCVHHYLACNHSEISIEGFFEKCINGFWMYCAKNQGSCGSWP